MIPKKIHYCWFGDNPMPEKDKKNIESWKKFCPDYEIVEWNESNYDVNTIPYTKGAYECKKYAFVADYARLEIVYKHGGIYMDTDVELIKNIDFLLENKAFCGREKNAQIGLGLIFGAEKGMPIVKDLMEYYYDKSFYDSEGNMNLTPIGEYTRAVLISKGLVIEDIMQTIEEMRIYPSMYFDPLDFYSGMVEDKRKLKKAFSIHYYNASWMEGERLEYVKGQRLLAKKYGRIGYKSENVEKMEILKKDYSDIKKSNGTLHAVLWLLRHLFSKKESLL